MGTIHSLIKERVIVLDGATGTELMARGLTMGESPERWNLEHPDRVQDVHRCYYGAGSDIVLTNTFGGSRIKLQPYGLDDKVAEVNKRGAGCARKVCPEGAFVGGDIGPTGKFLKPVGPHEPEEFLEAFTEQAQALCDGGADLLFIETMYDLNEALLALEAAKKTGLPVVVSLTFTRKKRGFFTLMGDTPQQAFAQLREEGAFAAGSNCSLVSGEMCSLLEEVKGIPPEFPLYMKPNAGQPRVEEDHAVYDADPEGFLEDLKKMVPHGARMIGGCCGTSPLFIEKLARWVKG
jgi:5-methyltetrahydrofolate--homocysteine methyltransferase